MSRHLLIVGGSAPARAAAALVRIGAAPRRSLDSASVPFLSSRDLPGPGDTLLLEDVDRAFPNEQAGGTRLVLTQSTYLVQKLIDRVGARGLIVATADRSALDRRAPEALQGCGPWRHFEVVEILATEGSATDVGPESRLDQDGVGADLRGGDDRRSNPALPLLAAAFGAQTTEQRLAMCRDAVALAPDSPVAHLALASALREGNDPAAARAALDRAVGLAPDWEAAHFEAGKLCLALDDMERARDAFQRACDLMPTFSAAFSNLGATAGELDEPDRALRAFRQALAHDPDGFQILNNIGVVSRELGHLDDSEAAFRRVVEMAPDFVFGHYNLGHTLFLAGRYPEALAAYEEGQRRDPEKNRRQGCRLAIMRLANRDATGAERDLWHFVNQAPPDERQDLLLEAFEIATALVGANPQFAAYQPLLDRIGAEIGP